MQAVERFKDRRGMYWVKIVDDAGGHRLIGPNTRREARILYENLRHILQKELKFARDQHA